MLHHALLRSRPGRAVPSLALAAALLTACGDETGPDPDPDPTVVDTIRGRLVAPHPAGAAVLDLPAAGVRSVLFDQGEAFTRTDGGRVQVVLVRFQPGVLEFRVVREDPPAGLPDAGVLQVADGLNGLREPLDDYAVEWIP